MAGSLTAKDVFADVFSRHAAAYRARVMGNADPSRNRGRARVLEAIAAQPGAQVLDLACGPGTLTLPLADAVGPSGRVAAVDLAEGMLDLLRDGAPPQVEVRRMDIEELAFPDAVFDAVACGHGLHFCPNLLRALWQARRVLRPGGVFAASVPGPGQGPQPSDLMADALAGLPAPPAAPDRTSTVECLSDPARAHAALLAAGFREAVVTTWEEAVSYASPEDLVAQSLSWWWCAWRLEHLDPGARADIERRAVEVVRGKIGNGRIDLRGSTHVLEARR